MTAVRRHVTYHVHMNARKGASHPCEGVNALGKRIGVDIARQLWMSRGKLRAVTRASRTPAPHKWARAAVSDVGQSGSQLLQAASRLTWLASPWLLRKTSLTVALSTRLASMALAEAGAAATWKKKKNS